MAIGRQEWIDAALQAFAKGGVDSVRVEALARTLKVTKGSFYWHFKDRAELLDAILAEWEGETDSLIDGARREPTPEGRISTFISLVKAGMGRIPDAAIFLWARRDRKVAARVARIERMRVHFLASVLEGLGFPPQGAEGRAELVYLAFTGMVDRVARDPGAVAGWDTFYERIQEAFLPPVRKGGSPDQVGAGRAGGGTGG